MLPLYTTIFTRCTFRLVSRPKRERWKWEAEERSFACRFHTFSAAMSEGTRFSFVRLLWRKAVSPTLSSLPLSYIYPGGVRVSRDTRGRSCCNFISRMRPHAPALCVSLFFSLSCFPCPFLCSARRVRLYVGVWQTHFNVSVKRC